MKVPFKPGTLIYPLPAVMVSCGDQPDNYNIVTVAWTGTLCTDPPMCYISLRPERHSYDIIKRTGEYVINLTTAALAQATDWCGVRSGRDYDKFKTLHLTPQPAQIVKAPLIAESPLNIEWALFLFMHTYNFRGRLFFVSPVHNGNNRLCQIDECQTSSRFAVQCCWFAFVTAVADALNQRNLGE